MFIQVYIDGSPSLQRTFEANEIFIGRGTNVDLQIRLPEVSSEHLKIELANNKIYITDLGALNGTYLNGEKLTPNVKYEYFSELTLHLAQRVALDITADGFLSDISLTDIERPPKEDPVAPSITSTQNLGLDITGVQTALEKAKRANKALTKRRPKPVGKKEKPKPKEIPIPIIVALVIAGALFYTYFR